MASDDGGPASLRERLLRALAAAPLVDRSVDAINALGVPATHEEFALAATAALAALAGYYVLFGKRHGRNRKRLAEDLREAQRQVHILEEKLLAAKREEIKNKKVTFLEESPGKKREDAARPSPGHPPRKSDEIRIFMDGAFDVMHYGHMNAFRIGRSLGTYLVVGVNSDASIAECKGPPLMNDEERLAMVRGCKFVDEVVPDCPYVMTPEYLDHIFETYDVDYVVHGDDPCIVDGKDVYESAKRRGRYRSIPRTEGVSTTDIVGRMLMMSRDHPVRRMKRGGKGGGASDLSVSGRSAAGELCDDEIQIEEGVDEMSVLTSEYIGEDIGVLGNQSKFLTTTRMLRAFSAGVKPPAKGEKVVYVDGAWDMFHCGHVAFLEEASKRGDYLIVGIHGDTVVNKCFGGNLPLMNLHERVLSVLGCRYTGDVLVDAPLEISPDMIASLGITEVVTGTEKGDGSNSTYGTEVKVDDRFRFPKQMGIYKTIKSPSNFKLENILTRMQKKQEMFQAKIDRKKRAEREWFEKKYSSGNIGNGAKK